VCVFFPNIAINLAIINPKFAMSDGETSTSRIIGSVDFRLIDKFVTDVPDDELLVVISGTRCCMPFTVKVGKASGMNLGEINQIILDIFDKVEKTLSNWNPYSEVNKVNALRAGECHEMSEMLREVILCSKDLVKSTNGAFDPSVGPILKHYESNAWNNLTESNHDSVHSIDSNEESKQRAVINVWKDLLSLGYSSDPKDLRVSKKVHKLLEISHWFSAFSVKERKFISKKHDGARLDLSGIAKGFTIDEIVKSLPSPCYVEWGGDLKVKVRSKCAC
jgi:thiamine biosynthesis lipoprotein ApbE